MNDDDSPATARPAVAYVYCEVCGTGPIRVSWSLARAVKEFRCEDCGRILQPRPNPPGQDEILNCDEWDSGAERIKDLMEGLNIKPGDAADILQYQDEMEGI